MGLVTIHVQAEFVVLMICGSLMPFAVNGLVPSNVADIFNVTAWRWSTAVLSQARWNLAATSLPNAGVAIFAGGYSTCCCVSLSFCKMGLGAIGA